MTGPAVPRDTTTTEKIIRAAERRMRDGGFHGFSFREIAADVGVKSSSVHHHFPTKEALGAAAARAYADRFLAALGDPQERSADAALEHVISLFRFALQQDEQMCLCGLLGAECAGLPAAVRDEARYFFGAAQQWLEAALAGPGDSPASGERSPGAQTILAALEGAMLIANATGDLTRFEEVAGDLLVLHRR